MPCPRFMTCEEDKICVACLEKLSYAIIRIINGNAVCVDCHDDAMETLVHDAAKFMSDYL